MIDFDAVRPVLEDVVTERLRQEKLGVAHRSEGVDWRSCADPLLEGGDDRRLAILTEEVGECARAILEAVYEGAGAPDGPLRAELVQTAAVAVAWVEAIDRRNAP